MMRNILLLLAEEAETETPPPAEFPWTMVVTLALSLVLLFVFVLLILPRKKKSPAVTAMDAVQRFVRCAEAFAASPTADNLKKVRKAVAFTDSLLVAAIYKGLVELNPAQAITEETLKVCKSLTVSRADENRRAEFGALMLDNALKVRDIVLPYAGKEVDDGVLALTHKAGANAYLEAVKAKHAAPPVEITDTPEIKSKREDE